MKSLMVEVGGWQCPSLVDVPFSICFTIWLARCNYNCPWCSNYKIAKGINIRRYSIPEIIDKLKECEGSIDYFHVTGGEPTLQPKPLEKLLMESRKLGFKNSLDTNGSNPSILRHLLRYLSHVAIDIKAGLKPARYMVLAGLSRKMAEIQVSKVKESVILASGSV